MSILMSNQRLFSTARLFKAHVLQCNYQSQSETTCVYILGLTNGWTSLLPRYFSLFACVLALETLCCSIFSFSHNRMGCKNQNVYLRLCTVHQISTVAILLSVVDKTTVISQRGLRLFFQSLHSRFAIRWMVELHYTIVHCDSFLARTRTVV